MAQGGTLASPTHMSNANSTAPHVSANAFATAMSGAVTAPAAYQPVLTPPHRQSFDTCYSDSVGSPDSERDFLTSPSMFDDAEFEFDADILANNFPLFGDQPFEDVADAPVDDPISAFASNLENVKLEAEDHDSQLSDSDFDASQATLMPSQSQSQVKTEQGIHDSTSTLEAAFKAEHDTTKLEPKHEQDMWSSEDLKPYFSDEENKAVLLSTLAHAFGDSSVDPVKKGLPPAVASASFATEDEQHPSQAGPVRSFRANRERRPSPSKGAAHGSASASPALFIDPATNTKRWQCTDCGKLFDRAYNLKTHRYTHQDPETRARPFVCPDVDCQKQFARKHDMQRHHENVHRGESRRAGGGSAKRSRADDLG